MSRVLIVDDEQPIAVLIDEILGDEGYETAVAYGGADALAMLDRFQPDLVLTDIMMPGMNGIELCRALRARPAYRTLPIILMSAGAPVPDAGDGLYQRFLHKPFDLPVLIAAVLALLPAA